MRAVCFSVNSLLQYMVLVFKFQQPSSHRVVADLSLKAFYLLESVCKQQPRLQIQHSPRPKQTFGINLETVSASLSTRYSEPKTWNRYPHSIVASAPRNNPRPHKYTKAPQGMLSLFALTVADSKADLVQSTSTMCDWEEFQFVCGHNSSRLLSYCHFARTDPYHQCFGVKVIKHTWVQNVACQPCLDAMRTAARKRAARGGERQ
ncbi:hypothetical protein N431DRAFT_176274 [Stipitochalara longipes BDJ]|nr:hypothetical protein N431DRAFT_176274 [Stipitochalara longipes BDJ]